MAGSLRVLKQTIELFSRRIQGLCKAVSTTLAMVYLDDDEAVLTSYVYKVLKKWPNGSNINQWIPKQTGTAMKWAYSLHLYDENGSFLGSEGAQREKAGSDVMLFPNPVHDNHTLSLKASGTVKIDLIDMQGRIVKTVYDGQATGQLTLHEDCSSLSPGLYLYVINAAGKTEAIRFVKE